MVNRKWLLIVAIAANVLAASTQAALSNVEYFDLSGWNSSLIDNGPGQTFNVAPGIDLSVRGVGDFSWPSGVTAAGYIESGHLFSRDTNQFLFTFSTTLPIVIESNTVDAREYVDIIGVGPETYHVLSGPSPNITTGTSGIRINGVGFGSSASAGETTTQAQINQAVILRHISRSSLKFEYFRIGTLTSVLVPEPDAMTLLLIGGMFATLASRRRNRQE